MSTATTLSTGEISKYWRTIGYPDADSNERTNTCLLTPGFDGRVLPGGLAAAIMYTPVRIWLWP